MARPLLCHLTLCTWGLSSHLCIKGKLTQDSVPATLKMEKQNSAAYPESGVRIVRAVGGQCHHAPPPHVENQELTLFPDGNRVRCLIGT